MNPTPEIEEGRSMENMSDESRLDAVKAAIRSAGIEISDEKIAELLPLIQYVIDAAGAVRERDAFFFTTLRGKTDEV